MPSPAPREVSPQSRHNEIRDFTVHVLSEVCHSVSIEPHLQPISGEGLTGAIRLYGPSSATALEQLQALTAELGNVLPLRQPGDDSTSSSAGSGPFLCLPYFKQLEKRAKLVRELASLGGEMEKLHRTAVALGVHPCSSGQLSCC